MDDRKKSDAKPLDRPLPRAPRASRLIFIVIVACLFCLPRGQAEGQEDRNSSRLTVAAVQYEIEGNRTLEQLLVKIESQVKRCVAEKAELVVFPELMTLDTWPDGDDDQSLSGEQSVAMETRIVREIARNVTPAFFARVRALSRTYKITILAGSSPRIVDATLLNTSLFVLPDGREFQQDKLNLTQWEKSVGFAPGKRLVVARTRWGPIAIMICYDIEFPNLSSLLMPHQPAILLVPSMTESIHGLDRVRWTAQARAVEHHAYVVISGTVGETTSSWRHFGQACVLAPRDESFSRMVAEGKMNRPEILIQHLDLEKLAVSRRETTHYPAEDARNRKNGIEVTIMDLPAKP